MVELHNEIKQELLSVNGLSLTCNDTTILRNVTLTVEQNDIVGIIGRSGAGKSTLLRCMSGFIKPTSGSISFATQNTRKHKKELFSSTAMIFQHFNLLSRKTALENVMLPLALLNQSKANKIKKSKKALEDVGLLDKKDSYPSELSGGQKQRIAIARAIVTGKKILLCDEPTSALDPESADDILLLLKKLNANFNITIIIVTHEISIIKKFVKKVFIMNKGKLIEQGNTKDIFFYPQHKVTKGLVSSVFKVHLPKTNNKLFENMTIIKIIFTGESPKKAIITEFSIKYNIMVNIISGYIDYIENILFGTLIISIDQNFQEQFIQFLLQYDLDVQVIKKVEDA